MKVQFYEESTKKKDSTYFPVTANFLIENK